MYIHAHTCARTHTRAPAHPCTHLHAYAHPYAPIRTCTPTHAPTRTPAPVRACTCTRMHLHHAPVRCTHAPCMRDVITSSTMALERIKTACNPFLACSSYQCGTTCEKRLVGALINGMHGLNLETKKP
jgi:hypothetical protein